MNNPYQENINMVKAFFRKPIILVYAIISALPLIAAFFINYNSIAASLGANFGELIQNADNGSFYSILLVPVFQIAFGVAMLYFYVHSRSEEKNLNLPSKLYRILSMIWLIGTALVSIAMILAVSLLVLYSLEKFTPDVNVVLLPALSASIPVVLLTAIGQAAFAGSVKESCSTIYLKRRGAGLFAVMSVISAVLETYIIISAAYYIGTNLIGLNSLMVPAYIFAALSVVRHIFGAVIAFSYNSYIKKLALDFVTEPESEEPEAAVPENGQNAPGAEQIIICKKCGKQLTADDYFCNHCGTPVEK